MNSKRISAQLMLNNKDEEEGPDSGEKNKSKDNNEENKENENNEEKEDDNKENEENFIDNKKRIRIKKMRKKKILNILDEKYIILNIMY